jgi:1,4-dihydroxy-2-naphthoate octaprenyltransferase
MSKGVAANAGAVMAEPAGKTLETRTASNLPVMIASVMIVTVAASVALMLGLLHGIGWQECALLIIGAALLAGGITYTIHRFRRSSVEGSTKGGEV